MKMKMSKNFNLLILAGALVLCLAMYMGLIYAPRERTMGDVQRIFYVHVPSAWVSFLAFFVVFLASISYLKTSDERWDILGSSSAEVGLIFCTLALVTGSLWAKPVWGIFWTWDIRLTTTLVLWFIYVAYLILRSHTEGGGAPKFAAVFGIVGFLDVPIVYFSVRWWRTMHPGHMVGYKGGLDPKMLSSLVVSVIAFTMIFALLLAVRASIKTIERRVESSEN